MICYVFLILESELYTLTKNRSRNFQIYSPFQWPGNQCGKIRKILIFSENTVFLDNFEVGHKVGVTGPRPTEGPIKRLLSVRPSVISIFISGRAHYFFSDFCMMADNWNT